MTKPPKYYNQVRIPAGSPYDCIVLNKSMSQKKMCDQYDRYFNPICDIECPKCMFDRSNIHHWKQWKKETFKGVKRCKKINGLEGK